MEAVNKCSLCFVILAEISGPGISRLIAEHFCSMMSGGMPPTSRFLPE